MAQTKVSARDTAPRGALAGAGTRGTLPVPQRLWEGWGRHGSGITGCASVSHARVGLSHCQGGGSIRPGAFSVPRPGDTGSVKSRCL